MSGDYINEQTKITLVAAPVALSTTIVSSAVDRSNFGSLTFAMAFSTAMATNVTATISILAGSASTATEAAAAADVVLDYATATTGSLAATVKKASYVGAFRWAKAAVAPAAATTGTVTILAIQGGPRKSPQPAA